MMKKAIYIILLLIFSFSCINKPTEKAEKETVYHIIHPVGYIFLDSLDDSTIPPPPEPPQIFYGDYNFILANHDFIYFYRARWVHRFCGVGFDNSKPEFLHLTTDSLIQINKDSLEQFLKRNIKKEIHGDHVISSIASPSDTITNPAFKIIYDFLLNNGLNWFAIRKWTEEEQYVSNAKLQNKPYHPDSIDWKIGFGGNIISPPVTDE